MDRTNSDLEKWFTSKQGHNKATVELAYILKEAKGIPQDLGRATALFKTAADAGNFEAQFWVAVAYQTGDGLPQNDLLAIEYYQKAVDNGIPYALTSMGLA
ncbi:hypothetical protein HDU76_007420 [Blyttiomyces sp. JEL0837]|nr:hypothetical protein HDU76_007420 [Blyttiomyces sp. JEL0837]